ncbi:MAG: thermonuclease family protein, partial [Actinobacteria bacterium]|nr:thermonuclease family protein [Actinomycetota bacterium]
SIVVSWGEIQYLVRYIGIDTPEVRPLQCWGKEATAANLALVGGRTVRLVRDKSQTDRYGRLLRYVYVGESLVNAELARGGNGYAERWAPDVAQAEAIEAAEADAKLNKAGLWGVCWHWMALPDIAKS